MNPYSIFIIAPEIDSDIVKHIDRENLTAFFSIDRDLKTSIIHLVKCDFVVTFGDWETNPDNKKAISIARILNIPTIHQTRYKAYVEEHHNR